MYFLIYVTQAKRPEQLKKPRNRLFRVLKGTTIQYNHRKILLYSCQSHKNSTINKQY